MNCSICGIDCSACPMNASCLGCAATDGCPFGCECTMARYIKRGEGELEKLKAGLLSEFNSLGIDGLGPVTGLNALKGSFINLEYTFPGGESAKFWDDNGIYLGNFIPKGESGRFYGLASDGEYLLVSESGPTGEQAEIIIYKRVDLD